MRILFRLPDGIHTGKLLGIFDINDFIGNKHLPGLGRCVFTVLGLIFVYSFGFISHEAS